MPNIMIFGLDVHETANHPIDIIRKISRAVNALGLDEPVITWVQSKVFSCENICSVKLTDTGSATAPYIRICTTESYKEAVAVAKAIVGLALPINFDYEYQVIDGFMTSNEALKLLD